jgi:hypothetical protein
VESSLQSSPLSSLFLLFSKWWWWLPCLFRLWAVIIK